MLDPDVVLRADAGATSLTHLIQGAETVAGQALMWSRVDLTMQRALINGAAGLLSIRDGRPFSVMGLTISEGKITQIDILADPERLPQLDIALLGG